MRFLFQVEHINFNLDYVIINKYDNKYASTETMEGITFQNRWDTDNNTRVMQYKQMRYYVDMFKDIISADVSFALMLKQRRSNKR